MVNIIIISYYNLIGEAHHVSLTAPLCCKIDYFYYDDIVGKK